MKLSYISKIASILLLVLCLFTFTEETAFCAGISPEISKAMPLNEDGTINNDYWDIKPEGQPASNAAAGETARNNVANINRAIAWACVNAAASGLLDDHNRITVKLETGTYLIDGQHTRVYSVSDKSINVPSDVFLDLNGSILKQIPNNKEGYALFTVIGSSNVKISNGTLAGDKASHIYTGSTTHEFGFGIDIRGGTEVEISNLDIYDMTGDSILIGGKDTYLSKGGTVSKGILIDNCRLHDNRRQGLSVMGAIDVTIQNCEIYNIGIVKGTDPCCGIDLENELDWPIKNVTIVNNSFYNNKKGAILVHRGTSYTNISDNVIDGKIALVYGEYTTVANNIVKNGGIYSADTSEPLYSMIRNNQLTNSNIEVTRNYGTIIMDNTLTNGTIKFNYASGAIYNNKIINESSTKQYAIQVYVDSKAAGNTFKVFIAGNSIKGLFSKQYSISTSKFLSVISEEASTKTYINSFNDAGVLGDQEYVQQPVIYIVIGSAAVVVLLIVLIAVRWKKTSVSRQG